DAERSSWCTCTRNRGSPTSASASGVEREPGATTASVTPARTHSSTRVAQNVAAVVTGTPHSLAEGGTLIHVHVAGQGRRPLVLVNGYAQRSRSWRPIVERLAPFHELALVDAPGHGDSTAPVADLWDGADAIATAAGAGVYVGYSMGARYALTVALARP